MTSKKKHTRSVVGSGGVAKDSASAAKAPTTGAGFDMAALHADAALVTRAGIVNGMSPAEIERRLIAAVSLP